MLTQVIVITLLYVVDALVHRAYNPTRSPQRQFIERCCLGNGHIVNDHQTCCSLESFNETLTNASYTHNEYRCVGCRNSTFEAEQETTDTGKLASKNATTDTRRFCFKAYTLNGNVSRISKWSYNGSDSINNSFATIRELCESIVDTNAEERERKRSKEERSWHCDSPFTSLNFWGANIVIFANFIYIVPYLIVLLVYFVVPGLGTRAYHKAVLCYNVSQVILNGALIGIGACVLCHTSIPTNVLIILGLTIMFLTISSTFWLFVICIDMTLAITRFRWTLPTDANQQQQERKKFVKYAACAWGISLLPTSLACVAEFSPFLPKSSLFRPNFKLLSDGANLSVILYVTTLPALTCLANTILFCYTSYKMILIQRSTSVATANSSNLKISTAKRRYFLFLRLYLLMDTPWISSALAAAFTDLWLLKFLRMIQPILMLLAILPSGSVSRIFTSTCCSIFKSNRTCKLDQTAL